MKTILEFTLPEESSECRAAQDGAQYRHAFLEIMYQLRTKQKHENIESLSIEEVRKMIQTELDVRDLNLE